MGRCHVSETEACHGMLLDEIQYAPITLIYAEPSMGVHFGIRELYEAISARFPQAYHMGECPYLCKGGGMIVERMDPCRDMVCLDPCLGLRQTDKVEFMETVIAAANPDRKIIIISADTEAFVLAACRAMRSGRLSSELIVNNEIVMLPDENLPYRTPRLYYQQFDSDGGWNSPFMGPFDWQSDLLFGN